MPGFFYVRSRGAGPLDPARRARLEPLARRLAPDNIEYRPAVVAERGGEAVAVFGGAAAAREQTSVCLGSIFPSATPWWRVGSEAPEGSFALVRSDGDVTEVVSDAVGTRTLWYAQTDDELVVSTSQRALVMWLGSYECNVDTFAWQISSGTLGPGLSWDRRIRALPPASRLAFDRRAWSAAVTTEPAEYRPTRDPRARDDLRDAIAETFRRLDLDTERGTLALSGGYDSRLLLLMLKDRRPPLHTVTWGRRDALAERNNDASVAQRLAEAARTDHEYFELEVSPQCVDEMLERFVRLGEGRIENLSGYTDGFAVWKHLH